MLRIVEKTKIWVAISLILIVIGMGGLIYRGGLNLGIDFVGGTKISIKIGNNFEINDVRAIVTKYDATASAIVTNNDEVSIRSNSITDEQVDGLFKEIKTKYNLKDEALLSSQRIGATIGNEMKKSAILASLVAVVGILIYTTIRFEFSIGVAAIVALIHDLLIMVSFYAVFNYQVNNSFIAAILTILGYSINDTIVIFDRIRENKGLGKYHDTVSLVNTSVTQSLSRSINTALTTLTTITCLYIIGVPAVQEFALPLMIGVVSGAYSTIFIASPVWMLLEKKKKAHIHA